ncbi:MAG: hypothetical protein JWO37_3011 [Acidimicrobiales bacterium]|jgi:predicted glycoside hydrolase/deacetylase ChbG (UPF0249 family)|nr:hypothetical protein [Acidimicrobiales bacterium]
MAATRYVIINADDFGQAPGINRGIEQAHERGVVTSASLMVRWPHAIDAARYALDHPELSVGLHVDLGEWYVRDGEWKPLYLVVADDDERSLDAELTKQITEFVRLVGRAPSHIDSHQHVHLKEPLRSIVISTGSELGVPVRMCNPTVVYEGGFYGQLAEGEPFPDGISFNNLYRILDELDDGVTEVACHPGDATCAGPYAAERFDELQVLCDTRLPALLEAAGIMRCNFNTLPT